MFNILLQVMDEGRMTDGNGVTVDFRNTIIVMTSNVGTRQLEESSTRIGFNAQQANPKMAEGIIQKALKRAIFSRISQPTGRRDILQLAHER